MQLTEKNLMVGDYLQYYIGEEGCEWDYCQMDWEDLRWATEHPDEFNNFHKPIPLTEDILSKIEGVEYSDCVVVTKWTMFDYLHIVYDRINEDFSFGFGSDPTLMSLEHLHQIQQIFRVLTGHELIVNF